MRFRRMAVVLVTTAALTVSATIGQSGVAFAATGDRQVSEALATTEGVSRPASSDRVSVDVPTNGRQRVALRGKNGGQLAIGLPNSGGQLRKPKRGVATYTGSADTTDAVIPTADGVQMLTVIKTRKASIRYTYDMSGSNVQLTPKGGAIITDGDGRVIATVPPAWAKDANGKSVPTRFVTDGKSLTQIVNHRGEGVTYPVVADPIVIWLMGVTVYCFIAGTYEARNLRGQPWWVWWWGMALACLPL